MSERLSTAHALRDNIDARIALFQDLKASLTRQPWWTSTEKRDRDKRSRVLALLKSISENFKKTEHLSTALIRKLREEIVGKAETYPSKWDVRAERGYEGVKHYMVFRRLTTPDANGWSKCQVVSKPFRTLRKADDFAEQLNDGAELPRTFTRVF